MMSAIYEENKDEDGFLYMTYSGENTFGCVWEFLQSWSCVNMTRATVKLCKFLLTSIYCGVPLQACFLCNNVHTFNLEVAYVLLKFIIWYLIWKQGCYYLTFGLLLLYMTFLESFCDVSIKQSLGYSCNILAVTCTCSLAWKITSIGINGLNIWGKREYGHPDNCNDVQAYSSAYIAMLLYFF